MLTEIHVDVSSLHDLPERVRVLLDPEDNGEGGPVLDVGLDALLPPGLLRQVHDLHRSSRALDGAGGKREDSATSLEILLDFRRKMMKNNLKLINGLLRLFHIFGAVVGADSWRVKSFWQPLDLVISEHITGH